MIGIELGRFAHSAIEARPDRDLEEAVEAALLHYARRVGSARPPAAMPRFLRDRVPAEPPSITLHVLVCAAVRRALEVEADRQGATIDQLATHAVLVYLADLDRLEGRRSG